MKLTFSNNQIDALRAQRSKSGNLLEAMPRS